MVIRFEDKDLEGKIIFENENTTFHITFVLALVLCFALSLAAQQIDLLGRISIHNSQYRKGEIKYVPDAYVYAAFAVPTASDIEGKFKLAFQGVVKCNRVELNVEKDVLEVVNEVDLLDVVLGRRTPIAIFLAQKGELAQVQTTLYDISVKALTKEYDQLIASLRAGGKVQKATIADL